MNPEAMKPFGLAIMDYYRGDKEATMTVIRDDGWISPLPAAVFFRDSLELKLDKVALELCHGRVLDAGAGTGLHALYLQQQGFEVYALDISPEACEIMQKQGVNNVSCSDISGFSDEPFDTLILLGRSVGFVQDIAGLDFLLQDIHRLVKQDGQVLLDSNDVKVTTNSRHLAYHKANRETGRYIGEIRMQFEYKGVKGPLCGWLHIDSETLGKHALATGWDCEVLLQQEDGNYLARLTKKR